MTIETAIIIALLGLICWRGWLWLKQGETHPDPWGSEIDEALQAPDALPVCHHCFAQQDEETWFCRECGAAIGPYNNYMPFIYVFSEGEVLRNGVNNRFTVNFITIGGYVLLSLCMYLVFAPVYWYYLFRNLSQRSDLAPPRVAAED